MDVCDFAGSNVLEQYIYYNFDKYFSISKNDCFLKMININILSTFWYSVLIIVLKLVIYNIHDSVFNKIT